MEIFIPDIGTQLKLTEPWVFQLYEEQRNKVILDIVGRTNLKKSESKGQTYFWKKHISYEMFLPIDTILTVSRIYIRNGQADFSSVSFTLTDTTHPFLLYAKKNKKTCGRFWAKLTDVNKIKCEIVKNTVQDFESDSEGYVGKDKSL